MKKRVLSMFMALALCLTLLPAPAWAAEADAPEGGTIVQEEQQEKAPAAESPAILEQAAENGIAAQNYGDSTVENAVAEVTSGGTTTQYAGLSAALAAAKAGDTLTLLKDVTGDVTVIIDEAITFDLNGHRIYDLTVRCKITLKDSAGGTGKIAEWLRVENGLNIGDLLEEGYALRNAGTGAWYGETEQTVGNVTVQQAPITSVTLTALNADGTDASTSIPYGTTNGIKLSASCDVKPGAGELSCQWYTIGGTLQLIDGATDPVYQLPADLSVGKHTYRVTFTADGYSKSADITITVEKIDLANTTVTIDPWYTDGKVRFNPIDSAASVLIFSNNGVYNDITVTVNGEKYPLSNNDYTYEGATATRAGKYTLTITATDSCANYKGSKTFDWEVVPYQLFRPIFQSSQTYTKTYDGTTTLPGSYTWLAEFFAREATDPNTTLKSGDYEVTAAEFVSADAGENKPINQTITLKNDNFVFYPTEIVNVKGITTTDKTLTYTNFTPIEAYPTGGTTFNIEKATMPDVDNAVTLKVINDHADTYTVDLAALLPKLTDPMKYGNVTYALGTDAISFSADGYYKEGTAKIEGGKLILPIQAAAEKKEGSIGEIAVTVSSTNIKDFALKIHVSATNKTIPTGGGSSSGGGGSSSSDRDNSGSTGKTETTTKPDGTTVKTETRADGTTVKTETKKDGSVTKTATKTETKPDGTKAETKSETVTNKDGSKVESETRIETKKDGTVMESKTETITSKDGTKSETKSETKTDKNGVTSGTETTKTTTANGSTGMTVTTIENGESKTAAETKVSAKAVEDAKKNGEPVKAPVEVKASRDSSTAPTVKVELPKNSGDTKVEIPVSNVKPGTVAVLVHADGTEEIVKNSLPTEDGIQLTVNGGATVKIVDNSKDFIDTRNHWAKDAIDFVSARELVNGMNDSIYAPNNSATRAQLWTILARQNDADLNGGNTWYEKAQLWSKDKGVSDGANPNGTIDRAQMVTMLWRAAGQPTAGGTANFTDVPADSYYANAVSWAVEGGITAGVGGGRFDPAATCTRAQIATFLWRAMAE